MHGTTLVAQTVKNLPAMLETRVQRSPGGGHDNLFQYSCLENPMDKGAWWTTVHKVTQSWTRLKWLSTAVALRSKCIMEVTMTECIPHVYLQNCHFNGNDSNYSSLQQLLVLSRRILSLPGRVLKPSEPNVGILQHMIWNCNLWN